MTKNDELQDASAHALSAGSQMPHWWWPLRVHTRHLLLAGLPVALVIALLGFLREPQFESRTLVEVQAPVFASASEESPVTGSLLMLMETQRNILLSATVAGDLRDGLRAAGLHTYAQEQGNRCDSFGCAASKSAGIVGRQTLSARYGHAATAL